MNINFISGGMLGDFIHNMAVVKNVCDKEKCRANVYLTDKIGIYNGDTWKMGCERAHSDLKELIMSQPFVDKFEVLPDGFDQPFINLNAWRVSIEQDRMEKGYYYRSWSELLSRHYGYNISTQYRWLDAPKDEVDVKGKIVIHRSTHRHNPTFNWERILDRDEGFVFVTSAISEWDKFPFKKDNVKLRIVESINDRASCINSGKYFIGNQSAPFALASALDVPRFVELDGSAFMFYMNEKKYSSNISWHLTGKIHAYEKFILSLQSATDKDFTNI